MKATTYDTLASTKNPAESERDMMHSNDKAEAYVHFSRTFARYVAVCHGSCLANVRPRWRYACAVLGIFC
jgi:hypothetical protein